MAGISAPGIGSGLDINDIVTKLMTAERAPLTRLDAKEAPLQARLSAFGTIKSALAALRDATTTLTTPGKFDALSAKMGDTTIASASASVTAAAGTHAIEVLTLAKAHTLATAAQPSMATTLGSGTITLQFGTYDAGTFTQNPERATKTITIAAGQSSLESVRDAINGAGAGISASIVNDGTGYRLALSSTASGTANALRITVADSDGNHTDAAGLSALAFDAATGGTMNLEEKVAAQDATLVVDGITVKRSSNVASDILEGVTLTLAKAGSTTLTVARDTASAVTIVQGFVKAYNDLRGIIKAASGYDADKKQGGILMGDASLRGIQSGLRAMFNQPITGAGNATTAASVGITFQRDGTLNLDSAKLTAALTDPNSNVAAFFASGATPSDNQIKFVSATSSARPGTYALSVSQLATRGAAVGSVAAATTIVAGANDALTFSVDGTIASATLGAGSYTAATLAIELQTKINEKLAAGGGKIAVTQTAGVFTVTSERYGAQSKVALTGGNALASLFGAPTSTDGADVAGAIGTFVTTAAGRVLTGGGLSLEVTGGATGDRGTVSYASGFAGRMKDLLDEVLDTDGLIADRTEGIDRQIEGIDRQREAFNRRMETVEARYRAQFTALDTLIARMNSTSNFLTQQLAGLSASLKE